LFINVGDKMIERTLKAVYKRDGNQWTVSIRTTDFMQYSTLSQFIRKQQVISWKESAKEVKE
jgi:hypothetical protein